MIMGMYIGQNLSFPSAYIPHPSPQYSCSHLPQVHSIHSAPETSSEYSSKHTQHSLVSISTTSTVFHLATLFTWRLPRFELLESLRALFFVTLCFFATSLSFSLLHLKLLQSFVSFSFFVPFPFVASFLPFQSSFVLSPLEQAFSHLPSLLLVP